MAYCVFEVSALMAAQAVKDNRASCHSAVELPWPCGPTTHWVARQVGYGISARLYLYILSRTACAHCDAMGQVRKLCKAHLVQYTLKQISCVCNLRQYPL